MSPETIKNSERFLRNITEDLQVDILFECFAGMLIQSGEINTDQVHVIPKENHKRNFKNDIVLAEVEAPYEKEKYFKDNERDQLVIYTSRSAILDYLPEDFYTEPDNTAEFYNEHGEPRTEEEKKAYREYNRKQLESAQLFFQPLEIEYNKIRILRELAEVDQLENFDTVLAKFWGQFPLTNDKWRRFVRTLHLVPQIHGDQDKIKCMIEYVLGTTVSLTFFIDESFELTDAERRDLTGDEMVLGFNVMVGARVYDYLEVCILKIEEISTTEFFEYLNEQSDSRKLINEIINHYFPLNLDVRLDYSIDLTKKENEEEAPLIVLGYSSKLG